MGGREEGKGALRGRRPADSTLARQRGCLSPMGGRAGGRAGQGGAGEKGVSLASRCLAHTPPACRFHSPQAGCGKRGVGVTRAVPVGQWRCHPRCQFGGRTHGWLRLFIRLTSSTNTLTSDGSDSSSGRAGKEVLGSPRLPYPTCAGYFPASQQAVPTQGKSLTRVDLFLGHQPWLRAQRQAALLHYGAAPPAEVPEVLKPLLDAGPRALHRLTHRCKGPG